MNEWIWDKNKSSYPGQKTRPNFNFKKKQKRKKEIAYKRIVLFRRITGKYKKIDKYLNLAGEL